MYKNKNRENLRVVSEIVSLSEFVIKDFPHIVVELVDQEETVVLPGVIGHTQGRDRGQALPLVEVVVTEVRMLHVLLELLVTVTGLLFFRQTSRCKIGHICHHLSKLDTICCMFYKINYSLFKVHGSYMIYKINYSFFKIDGWKI